MTAIFARRKKQKSYNIWARFNATGMFIQDYNLPLCILSLVSLYFTLFFFPIYHPLSPSLEGRILFNKLG